MKNYSAKPSNEAENITDSFFLTQLQLVVDKHNCHIESIDMDSRTINLDCPNNMTEECAMELANIFKKYLD